MTGVAPGNPCPFLRALAEGGYIDGHEEKLGRVSRLVALAGAAPPADARKVRSATYVIGLIGNGLRPGRLLRSWRRGLTLDRLRGGPLDKAGAGSRILTVDGQIDDGELARLEQFATWHTDESGRTELGLNAAELVAMMDANFARARGIGVVSTAC